MANGKTAAPWLIGFGAPLVVLLTSILLTQVRGHASEADVEKEIKVVTKKIETVATDLEDQEVKCDNNTRTVAEILTKMNTNLQILLPGYKGAK